MNPYQPSKRARKEKEKEKEKKSHSSKSSSNSHLTWALLCPMLLRCGVSEHFKFMIPSEGQTVASPPRRIPHVVFS